MNHIGRFSEEQKANVQKALDKKIPIYVSAVLSPDHDFNNLDSLNKKTVSEYLANGGEENIRNFLNFARVKLQGVSIGAGEIVEPSVINREVIYYRKSLKEMNVFSNWKIAEETLLNAKIFKNGNPVVAVLSSFSDPFGLNSSLIEELTLELTSQGFNPISVGGFKDRMKYLKEIHPDMIVHFSHGRMTPFNPDEFTSWAVQENIPYFTPQIVGEEYSVWQKNPQGGTGAMMGQNVVMPEVDGGVVPYVLAAGVKDAKGHLVTTALKERIVKYVNYLKSYSLLKSTSNAQKKVAIFYYKGPGDNAMVAGGLEVSASLLNILRELKNQGYHTGELPIDQKALEKLISTKGRVIADFAQGEFKKWKNENPDLFVPWKEYEKWVDKYLTSSQKEQLLKHWGDNADDYYGGIMNGEKGIYLPRIEIGNVICLPVLSTAPGEEHQKSVHGLKTPPPHAYVAGYLYALEGSGVNAFFHLGAHGSVEFIPGKAVLLSEEDWSEVLTFGKPHFYVYSLDNIGEAMMAKRRTYATMESHLTPPVEKNELFGSFKELEALLHPLTENKIPQGEDSLRLEVLLDSLGIKEQLVTQGKSVEGMSYYYNAHDIMHNLQKEKIPRGQHVYGKLWTDEEFTTTLEQMYVDYLAHLYMLADSITESLEDKNHGNNGHEYYHDDHASEGGYDLALAQIRKLIAGLPKVFINEEWSEWAVSDSLLKTTLAKIESFNVDFHQKMRDLRASADLELKTLINGLNQGGIEAGPGADLVSNPESAPTGRNLYSINAEDTPDERAWKAGQKLGQQVIDTYLAKHKEYPEKVALTLWGGEFIRNRGLNFAQAFYLLGVEPVRNRRGRVYDVQLIPASKLNRPRIDVVLQTSGQFRDIAASRMELIHKAIRLAAEDTEAEVNYVRQGDERTEQALKEKGIPPKKAKELAKFRIFGGVNGKYGTGIMGLVENSGEWDDRAEVAQQYLNNMSALYGGGVWEHGEQGLLETQLKGVDVLMQPRSSNATGPISLDHVYEFMGGLSNAIHKVNGKEADAFMNDNRNVYNPEIVSLEDAVWQEMRARYLNPRYLENVMKEGSTSAEDMAEGYRNMFGWATMRPQAVPDLMWKQVYDTWYKGDLGKRIQEFFAKENPYAMQEISSVLLEAARKEMWKPSAEELQKLVEFHGEWVNQYGLSCTGFTCGNSKFNDWLMQKIPEKNAKSFNEQLQKALTGNVSEGAEEAIKFKEDKLQENVEITNIPNMDLQNILMVVGLAGLGLVVLMRRKT